jgi:hypothetical protein
MIPFSMLISTQIILTLITNLNLVPQVPLDNLVPILEQEQEHNSNNNNNNNSKRHHLLEELHQLSYRSLKCLILRFWSHFWFLTYQVSTQVIFSELHK